MRHVLFIFLLVVPSIANTAQIVMFGPTLCSVDQQMSNGECIDKVPNGCPAGYYETLISSSTVLAPALSGQCRIGYNKVTFMTLDVFYIRYKDFLINFGPTLCRAGQYLANGVCTQTIRGDCPESFHVISPSDTTLLHRDSACTNGYTRYPLNEDCASGESYANMCALLCDAGQRHTSFGTCAALCPYGITAIHASTGHSWPIYAEKLTTPALNIKTSAGTCYINLQAGTVNTGVNIKGTNSNYHITD